MSRDRHRMKGCASLFRLIVLLWAVLIFTTLPAAAIEPADIGAAVPSFDLTPHYWWLKIEQRDVPIERPDAETEDRRRNQKRNHTQTDEDILTDDRTGLAA